MTYLLPSNRAKALAAAKKARAMRQQAARRHANVFVPYVLQDERTGNPVRQSPYHEEWQDLASVHDRLIMWAYVGGGKTQALSVGRSLWEMGCNPDIAMVCVSSNKSQATKIVNQCKSYIDSSQRLKAVFPGFCKGDVWQSNFFTLGNRTTIRKDPTFQALGAFGNILGARLDLIILDDILTMDFTRTQHMRDKMWEWLTTTLFTRLDQRHGRIIFVGNTWHEDDAMHRLALGYEGATPWPNYRYPILKFNDVPAWPERFPADLVEKIKKDETPTSFARLYMCQTRSDKDTRFKAEWIATALQLGRGRKMARSVSVLPPGYKTFTGVDLAVGKTRTSALTVFFTLVQHPNGVYEVLCVESGRWAADEIIDRLAATIHRFQSVAYVENNAAQTFLVDLARQRYLSLPIYGFHTGAHNKYDPLYGVEELGGEMAIGKWIIPNEGGRTNPEVRSWINEMRYYDPAAHTGDRLMASWIAREGARKGSQVIQTGRVDLLAR